VPQIGDVEEGRLCGDYSSQRVINFHAMVSRSHVQWLLALFSSEIIKAIILCFRIPRKRSAAKLMD
jgi:hypothetical protein